MLWTISSFFLLRVGGEGDTNEKRIQLVNLRYYLVSQGGVGRGGGKRKKTRIVFFSPFSLPRNLGAAPLLILGIRKKKGGGAKKGGEVAALRVGCATPKDPRKKKKGGG